MIRNRCVTILLFRVLADWLPSGEFLLLKGAISCACTSDFFLVITMFRSVFVISCKSELVQAVSFVIHTMCRPHLLVARFGSCSCWQLRLYRPVCHRNVLTRQSVSRSRSQLCESPKTRSVLGGKCSKQRMVVMRWLVRMDGGILITRCGTRVRPVFFATD